MSNITNLRKAGNLTAAYELAKKCLDEKPDDIWNKRNMAWVLYDFAKQKATVDDRDQIYKVSRQTYRTRYARRRGNVVSERRIPRPLDGICNDKVQPTGRGVFQSVAVTHQNP